MAFWGNSKRKEQEEPTVVRWDFYVGKALTDPGIPPISMMLTPDIEEALAEPDKVFWACIITAIEEDLP